MRAVVQRCRDAAVLVDGRAVGAFAGPGLVALVGVTHSDSPEVATRLADKVYDLRIFDGASSASPPGSRPRELSASDLDLPVLVVSQFTLYADTRRGRRPTWEAAAPREVAEPLVGVVVDHLRSRGAVVATGVFGADMRVQMTNDGPMTIIIDVAEDRS